jgi:hypothetical protein
MRLRSGGLPCLVIAVFALLVAVVFLLRVAA